MSLDIRTPIGLMFGLIGLILVVFGVVTDPRLYQPLVDFLARMHFDLDLDADGGIYLRSLGININFLWGVVLVAFSIIMLGLAQRAKQRAKLAKKKAAA
jgi:hypothetical protein